MNLTPPFLEQFFKRNHAIMVERIEAEVDVEWLLVFSSSWVFDPCPKDHEKEWSFAHYLRIVDMTSGKWDVWQELMVEFACPGDTPSFQLHNIPFDKRAPVFMPEFAEEQLSQAMRDFGFESTSQYRGAEGHSVNYSSLKITDDWSVHEKIQLRDHMLVESFRQIGFDVEEPLRNFMARTQ